ncbi:MAG: T9SS type A sorting domain-containing protein [Chitinophagales bacterium]
MRRYWLLILFNLLMECIAIGQPFDLITRFGFANCQFNSLLIKEGKLYCTGAIQDTVYPYISLNVFACFESSGELNYFKVFRGDSTVSELGTFENSLIKTSDGGFALCGYTLYSGRASCLFIKYDSVGNVVNWNQYKLNAQNFFGRNIAQAADGGYYITGTVQYNSGDIDIFVMKLDANGQQMWLKAYGDTSWLENSNSLVITNNNKILVVGAQANGVTNPQYFYSYRKLMLLDSMGNILLDTIGVDPNVSSAFSTISTSDGGYIFSGSYIDVRSTGYAGEVGYIEKLDSNLQTVWKKKLGPDAPQSMTFLYSIKEQANGELLASGSTFNNTASFPNQHQNGWVLKLTSDGDMLWSREYRGVTRKGQLIETNKLYDLDLSDNGKVFACGIAQDDNDTFPQKAWLIALDENGCLNSTFCGYTSIREPQNENVFELEIFPNPFFDFINVRIDSQFGSPISCNVYNTLGQLVYQVNLQENDSKEVYSFDLGGLPSGIYTFEILTGQGKVLSRGFKK